MNKSKRIILFCFLLAGVFIYQSCSRAVKPVAYKELRKISLAAPDSSLLAYTIYVGIHNGFFKEQGVEIVIDDSYPDGKATIEALSAGKADLAVSSETPFMYAVFDDAQISAFAQTLTAHHHIALVARKDRGIQQAEDIEGKTIAVAPGTSGEHFLDLFLTSHQLSENQITIEYMKPKDMVTALMEGKVDAVAVWNPVYNQALDALGDNGVMFSSDLSFVKFLVAARQSLISEEPQTIESILKGLVKSAQFIREHKDEADTIVADSTGIDADLLKELSAEYHFDILLDQSLIKMLEDHARWAIKNELTDVNEVPDFLTYVYTEGLTSVDPESNIIYTQSARKIEVAVGRHPLVSTVFVAQEKGYFKENGLEVKLKYYDSGRQCLDAVLAGDSDCATVGDIPFMYSILEGREVSILASIEHSKKNNGIVARKDRGIRAPSDLQGKRIGVPLRTGSEFVLDSFLSFHGLSAESEQIIDVAADEIVDALLSEKVDAVSIWYPQAGVLLEELDQNAVFFLEKSIYTGSQNIVVQKSYIQENQESLRALLLALLQASAYIDKNPEETQNIAARAIDMDIDQLRAVWGIYDFTVGLDQSLLLTLREEGRWAIEKQLVAQTEAPDFYKYIEADILREIAPQAVTLSR